GALDAEHAALAAEVVALDGLRRCVAAAVEDERGIRAESARACDEPGELAGRHLGDAADGRLPGAARRLDVDRVADLAAEQGGAERRGRADRPRAADRAHLDLDRLAAVVDDLDHGADPDLARADALDDLCSVETRTQRANACLE